MLFSHDDEVSLSCAVDLVNSAPAEGVEESLPDLDALSDFVSRHEISEVTRLTRADLDAVHRLRGQIRPLFEPCDDIAAARIVNVLVARAPVNPRLSDHDGYPWHMHYVAPGAALADHLAVDCGMSIGQVIALGERERLRSCAAPDCTRVLVDLSRNRSKQYCDARTCGNRLHVAAYRERRRAEVRDDGLRHPVS